MSVSGFLAETAGNRAAFAVDGACSGAYLPVMREMNRIPVEFYEPLLAYFVAAVVLFAFGLWVVLRPGGRGR